MSVLPGVAMAYSLEDAREPEAVSRALRARGVTLDAEEVVLLPQLLGRPPLWAEAVLFGILWSEHCSYKSTRHLLQRLPTQAPQVVIGPGEDAGVVALPAPCQDLVLVLAHESHNHPSQVLPVEGAATGVGGIVRDVVCMGATVTGVMDALRLGDPRSGVATRDITRGVVQGIADYGNALGVPNLGGDVYFDRQFDANCLVNVMAVGIAPRDGVLRSRVPEGPGNWVFVLVGKPTDDSGFGGAAFASENLDDDDRREAVQLPDHVLRLPPWTVPGRRDGGAVRSERDTVGGEQGAAARQPVTVILGRQHIDHYSRDSGHLRQPHGFRRPLQAPSQQPHPRA